ncbi:Uncharacterized conserved protein [Phaffia rhodozyma]|uniref:Uncharacterized conserved protein n=1 Tax=Phaffia rhodozyma TaxID=264483 RepID=A0A0F7SRT5_PHARH|nr:Uncharacterized conserved protein [Phaffia rhodozyma]
MTPTITTKAAMSTVSAVTSAAKPARKAMRSGLQREVLNLFKKAIKISKSKPIEAQPQFLLLSRWSFRHPALTTRDVAAIEHQIRKGTRTLEMLSSPSIRKVNTTEEMRTWWEDSIRKKYT